MRSAPRAHLPQSSEWFAAGRQVESALDLLSEAAFRLFMWFCLRADRNCGTLRASMTDVASALGRTEEQITMAFDELLQQGVCIVPAHGAIVITDRFWPYRRIGNASARTDQAAFIDEVRRAFLARRCVSRTFSNASEILALRMQRDGRTLLEIQRAILLGSMRRHVWLSENGNQGHPIAGLGYFKHLLDEVRAQKPPEFWNDIAKRVEKHEREWTGYIPRKDPVIHYRQIRY